MRTKLRSGQWVLRYGHVELHAVVVIFRWSGLFPRNFYTLICSTSCDRARGILSTSRVARGRANACCAGLRLHGT